MGKKSEITFKLNSQTDVSIIRDGKVIGQVWSEKKDGTTPYPHDKSTHCLNSIQICGFDEISKVWGCGVFPGKDCVVSFGPKESAKVQEIKKLLRELQMLKSLSKKEVDEIIKMTKCCMR